MLTKLILFVLAIPIVVIGSVFAITSLDKKGSLSFPTLIITPIRKYFGYCLEGRQIYHAEEFFLSGDRCVACLCLPKDGGVSCTYNATNPTCDTIPRSLPLSP